MATEHGDRDLFFRRAFAAKIIHDSDRNVRCQRRLQRFSHRKKIAGQDAEGPGSSNRYIQYGPKK